VERHANNGNSNPEKYHLNMYGIDANGEEVLFTVDHIVPESKGGKRHLNNLQTMCYPCNQRKKSVPDEVDKAIPVGTKLADIRVALAEYPRAVRIGLDLLPDEMVAQLFLDFKNEKAQPGNSLVTLLEDLLYFVEHNVRQKAHPGSCGPESCCDVTCQEAYHDSQLLGRLRERLAKLKGKP
jgi:hypothetical protein